jgi:serine/threonine protein phosphatase PrpC
MKSKFEILSATFKGVKPETTPNQDCLRIEENNDFLVATISDGLGSADKSQIGAQIACDVVVNYFKSNRGIKSEKISESILSEWKRRIETKPLKIHDYQTTNSFIVVLKNENKIITGRIGDVLVSLKFDGKIYTTNYSEKDFINETETLSTKNKNYTIDIFESKQTVDFLIASDGIGDELLPEKMNELFDYLKNKYHKISKRRRCFVFKEEIKNVFCEKNNDDKTIIFVWTKRRYKEKHISIDNV